MNTSFELLAKITDYLERRISIKALEAWLAPRLPIYLTAPGSGVESLVAQIELSLAEMAGDVVAERTLRRRLKKNSAYRHTYWYDYSDSLFTETTSTASQPSEVFARLGWQDQSQPWSTGFRVESV